MTAPLHLPPDGPATPRPVPVLHPARGGPWPSEPAYERGAAGQEAFDRAVTALWAHDVWVNPRTGERELNADLVLEGGGVKGIGLAGAICVLAEAGYRFPRVAGTSAGAIVAVLVAALEKAGADLGQLRRLLSEVDYRRFTDRGRAGMAVERVLREVADIAEFMFRCGLYSGDYLAEWLGPQLAACGVRSWSDLALTEDDDPGTSLAPWQRYRAVVHTADITRGMLARLPWDYENYYGLAAGDQEVVAAVRASMSIPFFFVPARIATRPAETRLPGGRVITWPGGTVTCVDGGMLMNFPISAFDRTDGAAPRWPTIGIKLSGAPAAQVPDRPARSAVEEARECLTTMTGEWDRYHVDQATADRTIFVRNDGITATQFDLSPAQQQALFRNGAEAATAFLIKWAEAGHVPRGGALAGAVPA